MSLKDSLQEYVKNNTKSVTVRPSLKYPELSVLKYKKSVFYNDTWDEYLEHCRGTVVDADFNLVTYPFQKIYNYGIEKRAPNFSPNTKIVAYRKVNGFMVSLSLYKGEVLISTTGSLDSDFIDMAKDMMEYHKPLYQWKDGMEEDVTYLFECVHPDDPHIIPEDKGMYYLGCRKNEWGSVVDGFNSFGKWQNQAYSIFGCHPVGCLMTTVDRILELVKTAKHEGFVFYNSDNQATKIKTPYYLTSKWVARNPRTDKLVDLQNDIKKNLDEEYHNLVDRIRENIVEYTQMDEQARLAWVRENINM